MAQQGLRSVVVKKYNHHANQGTVPDDKKNILKRDFETETINQKWCTDMTYIQILYSISRQQINISQQLNCFGISDRLS